MTVFTVTVNVVELTLEDLTREVAARLRSAGVSQGNGQVSPLPDGRTLRYYTTIGLLDRPLAMRGRQAVYGRRHVLQAVAVKRLQAGGLSLSEIQTRLAGLPDAELAEAARLPLAEIQPGRAGAASAGAAGESSTDVAPAGVGGAVDRGRRGGRWWAGGRGPEVAGGRGAGPAIVDAPMPAVRPDPTGEAPVMLTAVALGPATTLLVPTEKPLSAAELDAIRRAAAPLLAHLASAGHTGARSDPKDHI